MMRNPGHGRDRTAAAVVPGVALNSEPLLFFFDFVDPGSYLVHELLCREADRGDQRHSAIVYHPLELRPPPAALQDPDAPEWLSMTRILAETAHDLSLPFQQPGFIPWSRKAHELALHGQEMGARSGQGVPTLHHRLFRAHFEEGLDLGRVDVLVRLAEQEGLDRSEVHAVLGVDRFSPEVDDLRRQALEGGVRGVPTLVLGGSRLEGFPGVDALRRFLASAPPKAHREPPTHGNTN